MQPKHFSVLLRNGKTYRKNKTIFCLCRRPSPLFFIGREGRNGSNNEAHQKGKKRVRRRKESSATGAGLHSARALSPARLEAKLNDATDPLGAEPTRMGNPEYRFSSIRVLFWGELFEGEARRRWRGREDFSRWSRRHKTRSRSGEGHFGYAPCPTYGLDQRERNAPCFGFPQANGPFQAIKRAVKK